MENFIFCAVEIVENQELFLHKSSIIDIWLGCKYTFVNNSLLLAK